MLFFILFVLNACAIPVPGSMVADEAVFKEFEKAMEQCVELKEAGKIHGVSAGKNPKDKVSVDMPHLSPFSSEGIEYPLSISCVIEQESSTTRARLTKKDENTKWEF